MTLRAAIYARYSSDLQREASIDDQVEVCRRYAASQGWAIGNVYSDAAMSGSSQFRPGLAALSTDAEQKRFEIVVCEALDRLGRRLADVARLHDRLEFLRIPIHSANGTGAITKLHIGLLGTMAQMQLSDLRDKTHRGLAGRARAGRIPGGLAYGYEVVVTPGAREAGQRRIRPDEAAIVRRIFSTYAAGESPRKIAHDLNAEGIPGPGGRPWGDTTIRGQVDRGTGILNNAIYVGRLEWNRCSYVKDPSTGKRVARVNAREQYECADVPELRIVDDATWNAVKARQTDVRTVITARPDEHLLNDSHRIRFLLSGLLVCSQCGGGYTIIGKDRYGCATRRARGTCDNAHTITRQRIEARVLGAMRASLLTPARVAHFIKVLAEEAAARQRNLLGARAGLERQLADASRRLEGVLRAIEDGAWNNTLKQRLNDLERRKVELQGELAEADVPSVVQMHPNSAAIYAARIDDLAEALNDPQVRTEAAAALRGMIDRIVLTPDASAPDRLSCELHGALAAVLAAAARPSGGRAVIGPSKRRYSTSQLSVVAGAGFEPAAFRL